MGHRDRADFQVAYQQRTVQINPAQIQAFLTQGVTRAGRQVDGQIETTCQLCYTLNMIRVLVRHQYRRQLITTDTCLTQALLGGAQTEAAIYQQPGVALLDQRTVTLTTTTKGTVAH